jgi:hypothetical protein
MANAWFRSPRFRDANGLTPKRMRLGRWLGFVAVGLALAVSLLPPPQPMPIDEAVGSTEGDETAAAIEDRSDLLSDVLNDRIDPAIFGDTRQQYPRVGERVGQVKPEDGITAVFGTPEERAWRSRPPDVDPETFRKIERWKAEREAERIRMRTEPPADAMTSAQPLPSRKLSETEKRELAASGWQDGYPDGNGCMIERTADDGLNFVMISEGYSRPVTKLSFSLDMDGPERSLAEQQNLVVQIDDHRIPARVQGTSKELAEVEIPYTDANRSRLARARLIALPLGPVQLLGTTILPKSTSTRVIEECLRAQEM